MDPHPNYLRFRKGIMFKIFRFASTMNVEWPLSIMYLHFSDISFIGESLANYTLKMRPDQERVRNLLTDTVTLLCKNGLQYQTELRVQGVLGITLDDSDVFIVHINEKFGDAIGGALTIRNDEGDAAKTLLGTRPDARKSHDASRGDTPIAVSTKTGEVVHRRRRRSRESSASPASPANSSQQQILQRPIKRLMPSSNETLPGGVRNRSTLQNFSASDSAQPNEEDVKVKLEDDEVIIVEQSKNRDDRTETSVASLQDIPHANDHSAMQDSYPSLTLSELQGSYQPFGEILGVTDNSTNSGVDGTAPPPTKRRATSDNTHDSFGGSSEMGPTSDVGGPFITGIMRNETLPGNVAQTTTATSWDPSQMPDIGSLTPQDSQMILDSTPGCSTWNMLQQSQVSAVTTPTSHTLQNTPDQSSESVSTCLLFHFNGCMPPCAEIR